MAWPAIESVWPVLVVLSYAMAYGMMRVLSEELYYKKRVHNRIIEAREMRRHYFDDLDGS